MRKSKRLATILIISCMAFPVLAKDYESGSTDKEEKELKRIAHRMRIPVEQLENARSALQEATELAITLEPLPTSEISSIVSAWSTLQPSKAETVSEYFILQLEIRALEAIDDKGYIEATSTATQSFMRLASINYQKARELLSTWPYPPESFGESAIQARESMQSSVTQSIMQQIAREDPEALGEQSLNYDSSSPAVVSTVVSELARSGNKEKAKEYIDSAMQDLSNNLDDPDALSAYLAISRTASQYMDDAEVENVMDQLIPIMQQHSDLNNREMTLIKEDIELHLSRAENLYINMLRSLTNRPRLLNRVLDKYPEFESKFDSFGGIDDYFSGGMNGIGSANYQIQINTGSGSPVTMPDFNLPGLLLINRSQDSLDKLKDKACDNPDQVEQELRESVEDPSNLNVLTRLASNSARDCPELAEIALEIAEEFLPQIDDLQKRFSALRSIIGAYRNLDGEVDEELFLKGYILVDQIREEQALNNEELSPPLLDNYGTATDLSTALAALAKKSENADRLEAYLVAELARQDYDKAIDYVHNLVPGMTKLNCLIQIASTLRQNNF